MPFHKHDSPGYLRPKRVSFPKQPYMPLWFCGTWDRPGLISCGRLQDACSYNNRSLKTAEKWIKYSLSFLLKNQTIDPSGLSGANKMEAEVNLEAVCRATSYKHYVSEEFVMVLSYSAIRKKKLDAIWHQSRKLLKFKSTIVVLEIH